ncbi:MULTISPECIES: hypothetical protein [Dyella]|uniref:Uncharacterized protein n=2 Tax=Dyella TaxID=231454 RepID=A0A4R0YUE3_9GAMM|nr:MULTISPECIES: hypothetical protein [Dyella]TBR39367.1 hypothetical protein EYV96_03850 [Dyella terrae]TCI13045.1 hypothetical protein EZM97_07015 [Dyella soli]
MSAHPPFPFARAIADLEAFCSDPAGAAPAWMQPWMPGATDDPAALAQSLIVLLKARAATMQAAADTAFIADELRKFQKYAKPGRPSAHIIQLRQKQAAARQATNVARQSLIKAANAIIRQARVEVPERVSLDAFIVAWMDASVPSDKA